ncbi:MAG TPA: cryptochrome/photolyase family protein [Polyangiaceae bacterium]|nr:cryptochrome/photolyase family protein [Polyangiaceae bacterium]
MKVFRHELAARASDASRRRWFYVPYDQLSSELGPLSRIEPSEAGIVLVEAPAKAARRPYHQQKLALVIANQRQFALEQAARGVAVRVVVARAGYAEALEPLATELGGLHMMAAAERELRVELAPLVERGRLAVYPHEGWLTTRADFLAIGDAPWRMDAFYRRVRERTGILMERGRPAGGRFSHDAENRKPWRGTPPAPDAPRFEPDAVTREVGELIESRYAHHPGTLDLSALPTTAADAEALWRWALEACLPEFGPFEDAMSVRSPGLFHTRVSSLLNLHRLLPGRLVHDVAQHAALPLSSREGFVRQILGWREFVRHVHVETDGFRSIAGEATHIAARAGDGGFGRWRGEPWPPAASAGDAGALRSALDAREPLPPAYWGEASGLACLDHVVAGVWRDGWSHHITRLMILSNLATLLGFDPRELTDWFWVAYTDAYDWVVEPNVLAMGTYALGDLMTTKPYVSGANYIHRMSDYCESCRFDPKKTCPITPAYWAFLARNAEALAGNPRLQVPLAALRNRSAAVRAEDARVATALRGALGRGEVVTPEGLGTGRE